MGAAKLLTAAGGAITLDAASTATDKTITIPARTGNMAVDGPAFSAYQSSAQTLSSTTSTLIQLQAEEFDTASCFNNTGSTVGGIPAYSFMPTVAGYYQISGGVAVSAVATSAILYIYKNGAPDKVVFYSIPSSVSAASGSALVYLNGSTDYIRLYAYLTTGQALVNLASYTYFQAAMVRAA